MGGPHRTVAELAEVGEAITTVGGLGKKTIKQKMQYYNGNRRKKCNM